MTYPVKLRLYKNGHLFSELVAENEDDFYCPIEMDTGVGWLDVAPLYHTMLDKKVGHITDTFRVCHSYEKWGGMQQEVVKIKVRLEQVNVA